jgi:hypothetical protein
MVSLEHRCLQTDFTRCAQRCFPLSPTVKQCATGVLMTSSRFCLTPRCSLLSPRSTRTNVPALRTARATTDSVVVLAVSSGRRHGDRAQPSSHPAVTCVLHDHRSWKQRSNTPADLVGAYWLSEALAKSWNNKCRVR